MANAHIPPRVLDVIRQVAVEHQISVDELLGRKTRRRFAEPRWEAMWKVRAMRIGDGRRPSYPQIGAWFDRNHSSVMSGISAFSQQCLLHPDDLAVDNSDITLGNYDSVAA